MKIWLKKFGFIIICAFIVTAILWGFSNQDEINQARRDNSQSIYQGTIIAIKSLVPYSGYKIYFREPNLVIDITDLPDDLILGKEYVIIIDGNGNVKEYYEVRK